MTVVALIAFWLVEMMIAQILYLGFVVSSFFLTLTSEEKGVMNSFDTEAMDALIDAKIGLFKKWWFAIPGLILLISLIDKAFCRFAGLCF